MADDFITSDNNHKTTLQKGYTKESQMNVKMLKAAFAGLVLSVSGFANAGLITITGYDISNADISGNGGWSHVYDGNITLNGNNATWGSLADYTNGSGTLNDGVLGTDHDNTQLFSTNAGAEITLFLDGFYTIDSLKLFGNNENNGIPGGIENVLFTFGGLNDTLVSTPDGKNDEFSFGGSLLSGITTNFITLSNFPDGNCCNAYGISEINIMGERVDIDQIPEPSTLAIFALGIMGLASHRLKKQ
ncbi:PEP-CTERM sorting domain-containing protein [Colwellia piezophila]|uniref:PEP-CTERM sorting domain-containing protein n=1 Tax=Colwellia piezophila TaxID=211668 RepID=UPI000371BE41|nr:PEP-CTERM sorting domain-containing protein [Colwellia piezophila]